MIKILIGLGILIIMVFHWLGMKNDLSKAKWAILGLRLAVLCLLAVIYLDPKKSISEEVHSQQTFAIILDDSVSMFNYLPKADNTSWYEKIPTTDLVSSLEKKYKISYHRLSQTEPITDYKALSSQSFKKVSPIIDSLKAIYDYYMQKNESLAGMLIVTDGQDTVYEETIRHAEQFKLITTPINVMLVSELEVKKDIYIENVQVNPIHFEGKESTVKLKITSKGLVGVTTSVSLSFEDKIIASKELTFRKDQMSQDVEFNFTPNSTGTLFYKIDVPAIAGEDSLINNAKMLSLLVKKNNIRVLHIAGSAAWDTKFLRQMLKKDPSVDLLSFYILREPEDDGSIPPEELSLIRFPYDRLFGEEIKNFDIIFLQNFRLKKYLFPNAYIDNIASYVKTGGNLIVMGGEKALDISDYLDTDMMDVLPFDLLDRSFKEQKFSIVPTQMGMGNSWLNYFVSQHPNFLKLIGETLTFNGLNTVAQLKQSAQVILEAKSLGNNYPLMVYNKAQDGRVMHVLTNELWKLQFSKNRQRGIGLVYQQFIRSLMDWMLKESYIQPFQMEFSAFADENQYQLRAGIQNNQASFLQNNCPCTLELQFLNQTYKHELSAMSSNQRVWTSLTSVEQGAYPIQTNLITKNKQSYQTQDMVYFNKVSPEISLNYPNEVLMQKISSLTGGKLYSVATQEISSWDKQRYPLAEHRISQVTQIKNQSIWHLPAVLGIILLLLVIEWFLRSIKDSPQEFV